MNNNKTLAIIIFLLIVAFAPNAVFAGKKEYLDQSQTEDIGEYKLINSSQILAQIFQPEINGRATSIAIKLNKISAISADGTPVYPSDLIVEIWPTTDDRGVPIEEVIASAKINELQIEEGAPQWYKVNFTTPPYLNKKSKYVFVLRTTQGSGYPDGEPMGSYALYYAWSNDYDPYENGFLIVSTPVHSAETWMFWGVNTDCTFEIYMAKGRN